MFSFFSFDLHIFMLLQTARKKSHPQANIYEMKVDKIETKLAIL